MNTYNFPNLAAQLPKEQISIVVARRTAQQLAQSPTAYRFVSAERDVDTFSAAIDAFLRRIGLRRERRRQRNAVGE